MYIGTSFCIEIPVPDLLGHGIPHHHNRQQVNFHPLKHRVPLDHPGGIDIIKHIGDDAAGHQPGIGHVDPDPHGGDQVVIIVAECGYHIEAHKRIMEEVEPGISLEAVPFPLNLQIRLINGNIKRGNQGLVHPGFVLGIFILEFSLPWKHEVYEEYADQVKQNDLDGLPEPDNAFNPVHGAKLGVLFHI